MKRVKLVPHDSTDSRESIELDEFSDEDDEVFMQHSRNGSDSSARKPLMKKKRKAKNGGGLHASIRTSKPKYRRCCGPLCWTFLAFKSLIGILAVTIILVNYFTHTGWFFWHWGGSGLKPAPCHRLEVIPIWSQNFPMMLSEGNLRLLNISQDNVLDVVIGFGTGADGYNVPDIVCDIYFGGQKPCFGGILALDGLTGATLWKRWAKHEVFALTCQEDLNNDNLFFAISGKNGQTLWEFENHIIQSDLMSIYAAQFVHDLNGDGIPEILAVHGGDELSDPAQEGNMFGRLILFSGNNGTVLRWMQTPDRKESYYPPQILTWADGEQFVLFGTGGNSRAGALYVISLLDLYKRNISQAVQIYHDDSKGMLTPAALADINQDGIEDIIVPTFNSHVIAFDGSTFKPIWNTSFSGSESYSTVGVGFFDDDDIPDFMVKYQYGEGFPVYEYEQVLINSLSTQSSPLSVSLKGQGNDIFLHWTSNCLNNERQKLHYAFPDYVHIHDQARADLCQNLFKTNQITRYLALQRFNISNQTPVYESTQWMDTEHANVTNTSALAEQYLRKNPTTNQEDYRSDSEDTDDRFSVLPYRKEGFDDILAQLEKEMQRDYDEGVLDPEGGLPVSPLDRGLGKKNDVAYIEGEESGILIPASRSEQPRRPLTKEIVPDIGYAQPHNVQKNPSELDGVDNYENPYARSQDGSPYQQDPNYGRKRERKRRRIKRQSQNSGPEPRHKYWSLHRMLATGTLAPPILKADDNMDLIFASHWIYPARAPVLQPEDIKCVEKAVERRTKNAQEVDRCLTKSGHTLRTDEVYETPSDYNAFAVNMGQLTIYRFRLRCVCDSTLLTREEECGTFLPYDHQRWPSFMGINGDSRFNIKSTDSKFKR
ncbi:hypothetical protein TCAL_12171 [Tigriopus californicus]|uniref:FAM234A/B beta-propeller domain-containing protein n=1 Tax=Tigriopus californicus TaxID=6832 RepID=A0A553P252_TIGCA|nr:hypothetical protein TCAL_12171 [Tigriopus californicus]